MSVPPAAVQAPAAGVTGLVLPGVGEMFDAGAGAFAAVQGCVALDIEAGALVTIVGASGRSQIEPVADDRRPGTAEYLKRPEQRRRSWGNWDGDGQGRALLRHRRIGVR